jgi:hypothetical protein
MANAQILLGFQGDREIVPVSGLFHANPEDGFFKAQMT